MFFRLFKVLMSIIVLFCLFSCSKKGDFIDEGKTGNGVHYYPVIANNYLRDTITKKYLNQTDTTFSPGQEIIFEIDYFSKNKVDSLELWAGKSKGKLQKVLAIPYESSMYSRIKYLDTVLFKYRIPEGLDSLSTWNIEPRVVTTAGLVSSIDAAVTIQ